MTCVTCSQSPFQLFPWSPGLPSFLWLWKLVMVIVRGSPAPCFLMSYQESEPPSTSALCALLTVLLCCCGNGCHCPMVHSYRHSYRFKRVGWQYMLLGGSPAVPNAHGCCSAACQLLYSHSTVFNILSLLPFPCHWGGFTWMTGAVFFPFVLALGSTLSLLYQVAQPTGGFVLAGQQCAAGCSALFIHFPSQCQPSLPTSSGLLIG